MRERSAIGSELGRRQIIPLYQWARYLRYIQRRSERLQILDICNSFRWDNGRNRIRLDQLWDSLQHFLCTALIPKHTCPVFNELPERGRTIGAELISPFPSVFIHQQLLLPHYLLERFRRGGAYCRGRRFLRHQVYRQFGPRGG